MKRVSTIFSFGCKSYKQSDVKVGPQRPLRSDTSSHDWNSKISVNPSSILQPVLANKPRRPIFADEVSRGSKRLFLPLFPLFGESLKNVKSLIFLKKQVIFEVPIF